MRMFVRIAKMCNYIGKVLTSVANDAGASQTRIRCVFRHRAHRVNEI